METAARVEQAADEDWRHTSRMMRTPRPIQVRRASHPEAGEILAAVIAHLWPWRDRQYPGWMRCAEAVMGRPKDTVRRWLYKGGRPMPAKDARVLEAHLRARAEEALALADGLSAYAEGREAALSAARSAEAAHRMTAARMARRASWGVKRDYPQSTISTATKIAT